MIDLTICELRRPIHEGNFPKNCHVFAASPMQTRIVVRSGKTDYVWKGKITTFRMKPVRMYLYRCISQDHFSGGHSHILYVGKLSVALGRSLKFRKLWIIPYELWKTFGNTFRSVTFSEPWKTLRLKRSLTEAANFYNSKNSTTVNYIEHYYANITHYTEQYTLHVHTIHRHTQERTDRIHCFSFARRTPVISHIKTFN